MNGRFGTVALVVLMFASGFLSSAQELTDSNPHPEFHVPDLAFLHGRSNDSVSSEFRLRSQELNHGVTEIALQRTPCLGRCPAYSVVIFSDGTVLYYGRNFVEKNGYHKGRIEESTFRQLAEFVVERRFMRFKAGYSRSITDHATVYTSVVVHGNRKIVRNYASGGPARLEAIERMIDKTLEDVTWGESPSLEDDVVPELSHLLESDQEAVRISAVMELGKIGAIAKGAVSGLVRTLKDERPEIRAAAAYTLGRIGADPGDDLPALIALLDDEHEDVRANAAAALSELPSNAQSAVPALVECLHDSSVNVRKKAITALSIIAPDTPELYSVLFKLLENGAALEWVKGEPGYPKMRIVVLDAVRRVGPNAATATPFLIAALKHRLTAVVVGAANALGNIGPAASAAVQDLLELLDDDRSWVAPAALQALQKIVHNQDEIVAIVTPFVQQKHAISRYALDALGQITPTSEEILSELSTASRNEDPEIRAWAVQALGTIGPDARSELDVVMERLEDEDYTARGMAATAISNIAPNADETIATLIVRLEDPHWFVRSRAASALKQLGPTAERAIPSLRRLLSDENTTVRSIAAEAMKKIQLSASVEGE